MARLFWNILLALTIPARTETDKRDGLVDQAPDTTNVLAALQSLEKKLTNLHTDFRKIVDENRAIQKQLLEQAKDLPWQLAILQAQLPQQCRAIAKNFSEATGERLDRFEHTILAKEDHIHDMEHLYMETKVMRSCKELTNRRVSGKQMLRAHFDSAPFVGYCIGNRFDGGWLAIQRRLNGSLNFNRNWTEYRDGFGYPDGNFWIGLERLHQLTSVRPWELAVDLHDYNGIYKYARYSTFAIGSEDEQYRLTLGKYSGTAGDGLWHHRGMKFSTPDRDNDQMKDLHCAREWHGGWWFNSCLSSFLNGPYRDSGTTLMRKITWHTFNNDWRGFKIVNMYIRPLD
ncbi:fibrinogen-like protein 1 [Anopheles aquasalis]|uniref:fibrinogen-like protein 1 n=1 Tax=Anopheles aquasalis TaxID=42839 RepID=UPI00215AA32F|nr:fibrinogen-like protein 1 [Anopheles aquasalis]